MCHYVNETDSENVSFTFLNTCCVEMKVSFEKCESKACIKEAVCMLPQISFLMRGMFMPINLVYPQKRVLFLYFGTPNNPLLYSLTSTRILFNSPTFSSCKTSNP